MTLQGSIFKIDHIEDEPTKVTFFLGTLPSPVKPVVVATGQLLYQH
jgi:hypothetical protein